MFNRKAVFEFTAPEGFDIEEFELEMIDHGLDSVEQDEDTVYAYAEYTDFGTMNTALEAKSIEDIKANLQRIPTSPVEFTDEQMTEIEKMLDKMEDDEDVQQVFTNMG